MKCWLKENIKNLIIMSIYAICSFIIIIYHESWRDEANAWLIARDLNIFEIVKQLKMEGHFILWYLILVPFAKLGFPYFTTKFISWAIMMVSAWLILKKSPFKYITKILIIFSAAFLYWYVAVSRVYCIIPLAIILIALTHKKRNEKPLRYILSIMLLANTHIIMYGLVGMLFLEFFIETIIKWKKYTKHQKINIALSFSIGIIILLISILPLIGSTSTNELVERSIDKFSRRIISVKKEIKRTIEAAVEIYSDNAKLILPLLLVAIIYECRYYLKNMIMIVISLAFQMVIYNVIHPMSEQKILTIVFIVLLFAWRQLEEKEQKLKVDKIISIVMLGILSFNIVAGIRDYILELEYDYSGAKKVADFIEENLEENSIIICDNVPRATAVIPYVNKNIKFWGLHKENYFTYIEWDETLYREYSYEELLKNIEKLKSNGKVYYLYWNNAQNRILIHERGSFKKMFEITDTIINETYILYEI